MVVKVKDIINAIEDLAPIELALDWDNIGLMTGSKNTKVNKVLLCLDITEEVVDEAVNEGYDMIVSHHPIIFSAIKNIDSDTGKGRILQKLLKNDIAAYAAHTNLDYAKDGINEMLQAIADNIIEENKGEISVKDFAQSIKKSIGAQFVRITWNNLLKPDSEAVDKVCVCCGGFDKDMKRVIESEANVFLTGEVNYNYALDLNGEGIYVVEAGHYETEIIILPWVAERLNSIFQNIEFGLTNTSFNATII